MIYIKKKHIFLIILIILFSFLAGATVVKESLCYDEIFNSILRNISNEKTMFYKIVTFFASVYFLLPLTLILIVSLKDKLMKIIIPINLLMASFLNNILLKTIFKRERPLDMLIEENGYSFPSGHAFVAVAFYGFIIYLIFTSDLNKKIKAIISACLITLIILIGISRIYLGVHYPSDVTAGFIGGIIYLIIFIEIIKGVVYEKKKKRKKEKNNNI